MISHTLTLFTLSLLTSLVTSDPVTQYVEGKAVVDIEDRSPVLRIMDSAGYVLKMTQDLLGEQVQSVVDNGNILGVLRLAALTLLGLYILSSLSGLIVPGVIFFTLYSSPEVARGFNRMMSE